MGAPVIVRSKDRMAASKNKRSRRRGWLVIAAVGAATLLLLVLGTMDASLRYDLIGL